MVPARIEARTAARRPAHRAFHARLGALRIDAAGRTFVERHHDVAAEQALDFHGSFGGQHVARTVEVASERHRSEEHTSELQSLMRNSYAVFCLKKKTSKHTKKQHTLH